MNKHSGQQLNQEKITTFFSKAANEDTKNSITIFLGEPKVKEYEKYLGLLAVVRRNKNASLNYIKERVWSKLQEWKKLLSQAGREVLLKPMVQAIPSFAMSCFKLPLGLCDEIKALIRKFWLGQKGEQQKSIGKNGRYFVNKKRKGGWGSRIW